MGDPPIRSTLESLKESPLSGVEFTAGCPILRFLRAKGRKPRIPWRASAVRRTAGAASAVCPTAGAAGDHSAELNGEAGRPSPLNKLH
jgi:hypothetical protein